jgi:hypothetical protein
MTQSNDSTKQLKWYYGTRVSNLYEVSDFSVYNRLIARVQYRDGAFITLRNHKTDLASDELIKEHCEATLRSMEQWLADEVAKKLT